MRGGEALAFLQLPERLLDQRLGLLLVAAVEVRRRAQIAERRLQVPFGAVDLRLAPLRQRAGGKRDDADGEHRGGEFES